MFRFYSAIGVVTFACNIVSQELYIDDLKSRHGIDNLGLNVSESLHSAVFWPVCYGMIFVRMMGWDSYFAKKYIDSYELLRLPRSLSDKKYLVDEREVTADEIMELKL